MADLGKMAPKINWDDLTQTAALPLGSWLKIDPWDDSVHMLDAKRYAPMNARDKMPFEVTPVFYKLQRYEAAHVATAAAARAAQPRRCSACNTCGRHACSGRTGGIHRRNRRLRGTPATPPAGDQPATPPAQPAAADATAPQAQPATAPSNPQ